MEQSTSVLFLWHMHQPLYKRPKDKLYLLPWVRLHGVKDYFGFAYHLSKYPRIKANFNFSGVLLDQLLDYVQNKASDIYLELTKKDPVYLSLTERNFILKRFFSVNKPTLIDPYPRYSELFEVSQSKKPKEFTSQEIRDIQVYFNLVWFHPFTVKEDKNLEEIFKKGREFSEEDKLYIVNKQYEILSKIIPLYKRLLKEGQIEISVSPYYHPILPLLSDTNILKKHKQSLPSPKFSYPEEAFWQIEEAKKRIEFLFDFKVRGSWPSEGAVSEKVLSLYKKANFSWIATDEEILFRTLNKDDPYKLWRQIIYRPYLFKNLLVFFRDKNLSNLISFVYHSWLDQNSAVKDLIGRLVNIHNSVLYKKKMVLIAMDGENAWEYYPGNGFEFLDRLYQELTAHTLLNSETISSFIKNTTSFPRIEKRLWPGSWINADFSVWAGSRQNNYNWQILARLKKYIDKKKDILPSQKVEALYSYLRIIEGSDWNWWNTYEDKSGDFKKIFSSYVKEMCRILKIKLN
ncbi:MAG TPA: hypothetical protein ENI31_00830 [Candidatus Omnitrophica bacterium]|nr:MAG: hypothetical protein DRP80_00980 [Candidatus Omnitrophota bacterium]HEC68822.1 hypothetical protein [Candidatus Omnitrophota bacterium]